MKNQIEVEIAWKVIESLEALTDLIWEHHKDDFTAAGLKEALKAEQPWTE
jgi:hypothetical protein